MASAFDWAGELDDRSFLAGLVGSFWSDVYAGAGVVASLLDAKARHQVRAQADLYELLAAFSRHTVEPLHWEEWFPLVLRESERGRSDLPRFDGTYTFADGLTFGRPVGGGGFVWPAPPGLTHVPVLADGIAAPSFVLTAGFDFELDGGLLRFRDDPFARPGVRAEPVVAADGTPVDRALTLWGYGGEFDRDVVWQQFGYAVGLERCGGPEAYKRAVNAVYDALVEGTTARAVDDFLSAVCDVPLAAGAETVVRVVADRSRLWVVTDGNVYGFSPACRLLVEPGTRLRPGQPLVDALRVYELSRGRVPDGLRALAVPSAAGELVFRNAAVPLVAERDRDGRVRLSFAVGAPAAVGRAFWDAVHAAGLRSGRTLAERLAGVPLPPDRPPGAVLPAAVNPLGFLAEHVYRGDAFVVVVRPECFGPQALGLHAARFLRNLVPPHTAYFLVAEHGRDEAVSPDDPGCLEAVAAFPCPGLADLVDPGGLVSEEVRAWRVGVVRPAGPR